MVWKIVGAVAAVVVVAIVIVAITGGDSKSDEALAKVCGARADISQQLKTLQGLTPGSAREQAKQSLQAIADDLRTIGDARADLSDARRGEVQSANDTFVASVKDAAGSVTDLASLQTAAGDVKAAAQKLAQTYAATYGKIDCNEA